MAPYWLALTIWIAVGIGWIALITAAAWPLVRKSWRER